MPQSIKISPAFILLISILIFGTSSCKSKQIIAENKVSMQDNSKTSLDWAGTYLGILPCANCEGLKTMLTLKNDLSYTSQTMYLGKSDSIFHESGSFEWSKDGGSVILKNTNQQQYKVGENLLFHLDKNGKQITGNLAEKYILNKENKRLTGKYWKLVELNGIKITEVNRAPFIQFNTEKGVNGNNSCNSFQGSYELSEENKITFSPLATTRMACIGNNVESGFMKVLEQTKKITYTENELVFLDESENKIAVFLFDYFKN